MIVQAIADFTPEVMKAFLGGSLAQSEPGSKRERSRSKERQPKGNDYACARYASERCSDLDRRAEEEEPERGKAGSNYTYFCKEDLIKVTADAGNGWWYGYTVEDFDQLNDQTAVQGFFPSNYVEKLSSMDKSDEQKATESKVSRG